MPHTALSRLNWDDSGFTVRDEQGNIDVTPFAQDEKFALFGHDLPDLPAAVSSLGCIYLPMEQFLSRTFSFPLQHRKHLDADMLGQELADVAGIDPEDWWLSWRSEKVEAGVAGLVFGLPKITQQAMQQQAIWQATPLLLVDGWERLNYWLDQVDKSEALAVIDADAQGVFFGLFQDGAWQGMRRLNTDMNDEEQSRNIAQEVIWSLQAMGMDMVHTQIIGRLTSALADQLPLAHATHQIG
ncbi:MAG: hypothetical protein Q9M19_00055, partial [Mariprofundaceae bacterium]|nr:hypothetical protein [Mariprofundaceae bacterium]